MKQQEAHPRPDTALVISIIPIFNTVIPFILIFRTIDDDDSGDGPATRRRRQGPAEGSQE